MAFQFVENDKIDAKSRKLIRSHVMRGKNVGKTRRLPVATKDSDHSDSSTSNASSNSYDLIVSSSDDSTSSDSPSTIDRPLGDDLAYFTFPLELDLPSRKLIHQFMFVQMQMIYPKEFCFSLDWMRAKWFEYLQSSETFLHCSQLMATICIDGMLGKPHRSPQALRHLANTYRSFNKDLQRHGTPSEPDVAVVVSLAVHENLDAQFAVSKVHLKALQRMLELRGGIEAFSENWILWHKICRADIDRALHEGSDTMFYRDCLPHRALESTAAALSSSTLDATCLHESLEVNPELLDLFRDMITFSRLLDQNPARFGLRPSTFQGALILFAYRLLQVYPLPNPSDNTLEDALHIAALGYLTTILFEYGRMHVRGYDFLASRLRNAISSLMTTVKLKEQPALLWVLFAGGIALFGDGDKAWLSHCIRSCLSTLKIESWQDCAEIVGRLPWIHVVHDRPGLVLWEAVTRKDRGMVAS